MDQFIKDTKKAKEEARHFANGLRHALTPEDKKKIEAVRKVLERGHHFSEELLHRKVTV